MHSAAELDELASLGEAHGIDAEVAGIDREHCVPVEEGIISRIARLYSTVSDDDLLSYLANSLEGCVAPRLVAGASAFQPGRGADLVWIGQVPPRGS